jgi:hypothetical protein
MEEAGNMTDIDAMPSGPELDRLVAEKVMGWMRKSFQEYDGSDKYPAFTVWRWADKEGKPLHPCDGNGPWQWSPSTRIDHAWEVVEKMGQDEQTCVDFYDELEDTTNDTQPGWALMFGDVPAPLVICRTALKAVGEKT